MKKLTAVLLLTAMTAGLAACGSNKGADTNTDAPAQNESTEKTVTTETSDAAQNADIQGTITLAAAASLEKSFTEHLIPMFEEANPGVTVKGTYDSSGKLQTQIEEGAPADLFFSAATKQMTALNDEGLMDPDSIVKLLENKVVLIVPEGSDKDITSFEDVATDKVGMIGLGEPGSVPVGQYSEEIFTSLGILDTVKTKANYGSDVRTVLSWVETGAVDCGVVYATDAYVGENIQIVCEAPVGSCKQVIYPVGIVKASENADAAAEFLAYLQTDHAMQKFEGYGFSAAE